MTDWKQTVGLWAFGLFKIPLLFIVRPQVVHLDKKSCVVQFPLNYLTKNHLGSMYFGVLAMGADCAGGMLAMEAIRRSGEKVDLVFKDFKADFLRRAEGDVHFICHDGIKARRLVDEAIRTRKRVNRRLTILATTPDVSGDHPVAKFHLTLSLKAK